jgi:hypothetical protein
MDDHLPASEDAHGGPEPDQASVVVGAEVTLCATMGATSAVSVAKVNLISTGSVIRSLVVRVSQKRILRNDTRNEQPTEPSGLEQFFGCKVLVRRADAVFQSKM